MQGYIYNTNDIIWRQSRDLAASLQSADLMSIVSFGCDCQAQLDSPIAGQVSQTLLG